MVGLRSEGWDRGMAVDQIQLKKPEVIRSIVDTAGSFQDLLGDITWERLGRFHWKKKRRGACGATILPKSLFPDSLIWFAGQRETLKWLGAPEWRKLLSRKSSIPRHLIPFCRYPPYRVSDRAYSKTIVFPSRHPLSNPSNDSWNSRKKHYFFQWFQLVDDYVDIVGRINRYGIFNAEKRSCPRLREGNAENAIVRRLIDFAKTMPRGRNFLGFMPFLNDAGAQAHHVSPRSSTREWCARFFANENPLTGLKPSYTYIYIYIFRFEGLY